MKKTKKTDFLKKEEIITLTEDEGIINIEPLIMEIL